MICTWRGAVWIGCVVAIAAVATPQAQTKETPPNPHRAMGDDGRLPEDDGGHQRC